MHFKVDLPPGIVNALPSSLRKHGYSFQLVTIQSCAPSDPLRGTPIPGREAFGEEIRPVGSLPEGAGWPPGQTEGVLGGRTESLHPDTGLHVIVILVCIENRFRHVGRQAGSHAMLTDQIGAIG